MMQPAGTHSPVLRRAVMRVQSGFYSWDETRQLHYRMHMPDHERFLLERSIFRDLYGVDCRTQDALRTAWDQIPIGDLDAINETLLPWRGIGEDSFYLNEYMPADWNPNWMNYRAGSSAMKPGGGRSFSMNSIKRPARRCISRTSATRSAEQLHFIFDPGRHCKPSAAQLAREPQSPDPDATRSSHCARRRPRSGNPRWSAR